jgi:uncharacterized protein (DUF2147 family)
MPIARWMRVPALFAAVALLCAAAPPDRGIEGVWRNSRDTVHLRLAQCGEALCGTVVWANATAKADALKGSGQKLVGSRLITDLRRNGEGSWRGRVYVPDIDRRASATVVQVNPDMLRVSGCLIAGLLCQTRHWHRIR